MSKKYFFKLRNGRIVIYAEWLKILGTMCYAVLVFHLFWLYGSKYSENNALLCLKLCKQLKKTQMLIL